MNAIEVNVMLTRAALLDPRMKRSDPTEQADMATAWAQVLGDVPLQAALTAVVAHYRDETRSLMPADVVALTAEMPTADRTGRADGREWLEARGIDPDAFERRVADGERPVRVLRELGVIEP
jgi:hypothetical protein